MQFAEEVSSGEIVERRLRCLSCLARFRGAYKFERRKYVTIGGATGERTLALKNVFAECRLLCFGNVLQLRDT